MRELTSLKVEDAVMVAMAQQRRRSKMKVSDAGVITCTPRNKELYSFCNVSCFYNVWLIKHRAC